MERVRPFTEPEAKGPIAGARKAGTSVGITAARGDVCIAMPIPRLKVRDRE